MTDNYFGKVEQKSKGFYIALAIIALSFLMSMNTDLQFFAQSEEVHIPTGFIWIIFVLDFLILLMLLLIVFFRKVGVIVFPFLVLIHFLLYNFYLSSFLYFDLSTLFCYFMAGLFVVIPRWSFFK